MITLYEIEIFRSVIEKISFFKILNENFRSLIENFHLLHSLYIRLCVLNFFSKNFENFLFSTTVSYVRDYVHSYRVIIEN